MDHRGLFVRGLAARPGGVGFVLRFFSLAISRATAFLFGAGAVVLLFFMLWAR